MTNWTLGKSKLNTDIKKALERDRCDRCEIVLTPNDGDVIIRRWDNNTVLLLCDVLCPGK